MADVVIAVAIAALLAATVAAVVSIAPAMWSALTQSVAVERTVNPRQCAAIESAEERLACFDKYADALMIPPAKGAFAPAQAFGQRAPGSDPH